MSPRYHPSHAMLVDYAAGALQPGRALVMATHVHACPLCRQEVTLAESVGGALLDELPPVAMAAGALEAALARLDEPPPEPPSAAAAQPRPDWIEVPNDVLEAALKRKRWAAPGVWVAPISKGPKGQSTYLLRVAAGMAVPLHSHKGVEMICVLKGAYKDRGHIHRPGDIGENDESVEHRPKVTREGECVCLIAADGPLVARDWVGRLFQPFVGI